MTKIQRGRKVKFSVTDKKRIDDADKFLMLAFNDYLAARALFLNCLLSQGAILASTSIEKYFKAIISLKGNACQKHLGRPLVNALRNAFRELFAALNNEFMGFLEKAYKLRYVDDLEKDFNLCISKRKTLAELDFTVAEIENRLVREQEGKAVETLYGVNPTSTTPGAISP
jgi:hypothetical protein